MELQESTQGPQRRWKGRVKDKKGETPAWRRETSWRISSVYINILRNLQSGWSQGILSGIQWQVTVQWPKYNRGDSLRKSANSTYCVVERALGQVDISLLANIKKFSVHSPGQPALDDISRTRELGRLTSKSPLLTQIFCDSVIISSKCFNPGLSCSFK